MFECTEIKDNKTGLIYSIKHIRISDTFNYSADTRYFIDLYCEKTGYEYLNIELKRFWNGEKSMFDYLIDDFTRPQMPDNNILDMSKLLGRPPYIEVFKERYTSDDGVPTARFEINPEQPTEPKERIYINIVQFEESNYAVISTMINALEMLLENYALQNCGSADMSDILFFVADNLKRINDFCNSENIPVGYVEKEFIYKK